MRMTPTTGAAADAVGAVSAGLGGLLVLAPDPGGRWLGLDHTDLPRRRVLGILDLGLGVTILAGRAAPWRWGAVAARSLLHLGFAHQYVRNGRPASAAAMCALFALDAGIATSLRRRRLRAGLS